MRKLTAIVFFIVFLFNLSGYRLLLNYWESRENDRLEARLDKNDYDEKDLVEVKIPIRLPYFYNWKEFERCDGEVELNGVQYKYVKRKVYNDSLVLMCIPNQAKMKMHSARDEMFSLINDIQSNTSNKHSDNSNPFAGFKNTLSDYDGNYQDWEFASLSTSFSYGFDTTPPILTANVRYPEQPPDA